MKKLFAFIALFTTFAKSEAQSVATIDKTIAGYINQIGDLRNGDSDSLMSVNDVLLQYMLTHLAKDPSLLTAHLPVSKDARLNYITSSDGRLRCYDWNTETGGTMYFFKDLVQYKTSHGVAVMDMADRSVEADPGYYFDTVYTIKSGKETVYMVTQTVVGSTRDRGKGITAYKISNDKLVKAAIFHTKKDKLSEVFYGYDFFSSEKIVNREMRTDISFSPDMKKMYVPMVTDKGAFTGKLLIYLFDGANYVFDKNAK